MIRSLWSQWNILVLENDILYRKYTEEDKNSSILQAVVPTTERRMVLKFCHDLETAGHLGVTKTLSRIRQKYYWPGLQADTRAYIAGCEKCSRRKHPQMKKKAPMTLVESGLPMDRIATDILGELPLSENGNKYILVVSDYFSKWTESFPMPNMEAATVARIIVEEVVSRFGVPSSIHSDQGRQYESELFSEVCRVLQIKKTRTTPYHPQSDGMVERFNKTLATMLSAYVNEHHSDWDSYLPYVMMAYRASVHETTGFTPNYLMLGREVSTPLDIMYEMPNAVKYIPRNKWAWQLKERMEEAHKYVRENIKTAMVRQKKYHDQKLSWQMFSKGDQVYVYFPLRKVGLSPKFTSYWRGPYEVIDKITDVTFKVNCGPRGKTQVVHVDRLRLKRDQILRNERESSLDNTNHSIAESREPEIENLPSEVDENPETFRSGRIRKAPGWLQDYVY